MTMLSPIAAGRQAEALALTALVRETVAAGLPRQALHLRLAGLPPRLSRGHHHRLLREALEPLLRPSRGRLFELPNGDLVAVAPPGGAHLRLAEERLATLLAAELPAPLFAMLRLPEEAAALLAAVEAALAPSGAPPPPGPAETGFTTADLAALEQALGSAGLASFLRQHPVCRLAPQGEGPEVEWQDWRIALPELHATLLSRADPAGAPWLLRRLRRLLDRRLLAELSRPEAARRLGRIGIGLSLASLTAPDFLRLDEALGAAGRAGVVIGLSPADILADPEGFAFAREFCRARGYRLALDGVEGAALPLLPLDRLGLDLLWLRWAPGLPAFGAALPAARERVVLTGADSAAAIGWGWEEGITLFQGRLLRPRG